MKKWLTLGIVGILVGCAQENPTKVEVEMHNSDSDSVGTITISEQADGVELELDLNGLSPGEHAIHFHNVGSCEPPDFISAGDHLNPDEAEHGLMNPNGAHLGDLPNIIADEAGVVTGTLKAKATLKDNKDSLVTRDGTSLVIHANVDDGMSQPAGNAGERIACGVISKDMQIVK